MTSVDRIQGLSGSLAVKAPVRVATTAAITLSGEQTIDGVAVVEGDRVLVKSQTSSVDNGIYNVSTGGWTRALDFNGANDFVQGTAIVVQQGATYADTMWKVTTASPAIGSALAFDQLVPGDASAVEFTPAGTGAIATTVQAKLRETPSPAGYSTNNDYLAACLALATGMHFAQNGAIIHRVFDRLLIGRAAENDGAFPCVSQDWMTEYQIAAGLSSGTIMSSVGAVLNDEVASSVVGWISGSQSKDFTSAGSSCIGGMDFALNNNLTYATQAWARYGEAHLEATAVGFSIYGTEYNVRAMQATTAPHPWQQGTAVGHQIGAGCGLSATGQFDASCAAQIVANPKKWKAGINFMADSLVGTDGTLAGTTAVATAVAMANYQALNWYRSDGTVMGSIHGACITKAAGIIFNDSVGVMMTGDAGQPLFGVQNVTSAVNFLVAVPNVAGNEVRLSAIGTDTNIDILLAAKGSGVVRFGTHTGGGDTASNGYITVKDSGGTVRKLMTTA